MTLQALKGGMWFPERAITDTGNPIIATTLNVASEIGGFVVTAPKAGDIDRVIYSFGTVAITSGPLNFSGRLETMGATGLNSGSLIDTDSSWTDSVADGDDNVQREMTLTGAATVTKGQKICFFLQAPGSGTFSVTLQGLGGDFTGKFPYSFNDSSKVGRVPILGFRYTDGTYHAAAGCFPCQLIGSTNNNSTDDPDEYGNKFQYPFPCKVGAISLFLDPNSSSDFTVRIYNASDTVLLEHTFDSDDHPDYGDGSMTFDLDDEITIAANTVYRCTVRPNTSDHELFYFDVSSAAFMDMFDGGQNVHATHRVNDGTWVDTTTRRYFVSLKITALDDGAGGGGGGGKRSAVVNFG